MISTTSNDVIVLDVEKYPQVGEWGIRVGTYLGLESYHLADEYFKYIPQHITYLRYPSKNGIMGDKYWGEIRFQRSAYGVNEEGTTNKEKEDYRGYNILRLCYSFYDRCDDPSDSRRV